ncbi:cytochrome P450, partial [Streptomyces sp. SID3343]|nr:cytochrome P450 [Streptomyces sp. SID3343]
MRDRRGARVFRVDADTVGIADPELIDRLLGSRLAHEFERPTFKPLQGRSIPRAEAADVLHAISQDTRAALSGPAPHPVDLSGSWPRAGHAYLRALLFGSDPLRLRILTDRRLEATPALVRTAIRASTLWPGKAGPGA